MFPKHIKHTIVHQPKQKRRIKVTKKQLAATSILVIFLGIIVISFLIVPITQGRMHLLTVLSGSMEPNIQTGDVVVSCFVDVAGIQEGDVITFRYDDEEDPYLCFTHRVIAIVEENGSMMYQTKGDANEAADLRLVKPSEVIGKVTMTLPYLGYLSNFARSRTGYIVFLILPACLIIINEARRIYHIRKEDKLSK
jgi:signal peptidase